MSKKEPLTKDTFIPLICITIWIIILNFAVQVLVQGGHHWAHYSWTMFMISIFYFVMHEKPKKEKYIEIYCGGISGMLLTFILIFINIKLATAGVAPLAAIMIPLIVIIAFIIVGGPVLPYCCNNVAFTYLIIGALNAETFYTEFVIHIGYFLIGGTIMMLGIEAIIYVLTQSAIKKAKLAAANSNQVSKAN